MDIKNFKTGQTAYSVYFKSGKYIIKKEIVCKSGRKYVYTENEYNKYELFYGDEDYLIESEYSGYKKMLFLTEQDAKDYIEKQDLITWIKHIDVRTGYSLKQLRAVKRILEDKNYGTDR